MQNTKKNCSNLIPSFRRKSAIYCNTHVFKNTGVQKLVDKYAKRILEPYKKKKE